MKLTAIRPMSYKTRRMQAGDEFDATATDAKILIAMRKARYLTREIGAFDPPPAPVAEAIGPPPDHDAERDALRELAQSMGIDVDGRWGVARLEQEIERVKSAPSATARHEHDHPES